jgi:hypothetical protein
LFLADILPRHTLTASLVWPWLVNLLAGLSLKAAVEKLRLPFALETIYRLQRKLKQGLDSVRARLCRRQAPPPSTQTEPLLQTVEHLQTVFSGRPFPPADFQLEFQHPFWVEVLADGHRGCCFCRIAAAVFVGVRVPGQRQHDNTVLVSGVRPVASPA